MSDKIESSFQEKKYMNRIAAVMILAALAFSGCTKKENAATTARLPSTPVFRGAKILVLSSTALRDEREVMGTVRSSEIVTLSSKLLGTITSIPVRLGMHVSKGQLIARIDAKDIEAQIGKVEAAIREADEGGSELESADLSAQSAIKAAEANRDFAHATLARFKTLFERGSVSRQEFEEVEARYKAADAETMRAREARNAIAAKGRQISAKKDQARADLVSIKANLAYGTIVSPVSGVIVSKHAEEGMLAAPGVPLVVIEEEGKSRLEVLVEESMLSGIKLGDSVPVVIESLGNIERMGRVHEISPVSDQFSRTVTVKISLDDQKALKSGFFGRARFPGLERKALLIPRSALVEKGQLTGVYSVDADNTAHLALVKTGGEFPQGIEIVAGLSEGWKIVVNPGVGLNDGTRLE